MRTLEEKIADILFEREELAYHAGLQDAMQSVDHHAHFISDRRQACKTIVRTILHECMDQAVKIAEASKDGRERSYYHCLGKALDEAFITWGLKVDVEL